MISGLSDDNVRLIIEIIHKPMPQNSCETEPQAANKEAMQAVYKLDTARTVCKSVVTKYIVTKMLMIFLVQRYQLF